jgi:hypothetical protein
MVIDALMQHMFAVLDAAERSSTTTALLQSSLSAVAPAWH